MIEELEVDKSDSIELVDVLDALCFDVAVADADTASDHISTPSALRSSDVATYQPAWFPSSHLSDNTSRTHLAPM
jgi:hypothetical protein